MRARAGVLGGKGSGLVDGWHRGNARRQGAVDVIRSALDTRAPRRVRRTPRAPLPIRFVGQASSCSTSANQRAPSRCNQRLRFPSAQATSQAMTGKAWTSRTVA